MVLAADDEHGEGRQRQADEDHRDMRLQQVLADLGGRHAAEFDKTHTKFVVSLKLRVCFHGMPEMQYI